MDLRKPWEDLPQGIRKLVLSELPWVMSHQRKPSTVPDESPFICQLFDPYSKNVHKISNWKGKFKEGYHKYLKVFASKYGWLLIGGESSSFFFHNPFTSNTILLPDYLYNLRVKNIAATFTSNPESPECEVFLISQADDFYLHICTYCLSKGKDWSKKLLEMTGEQLLSVHHMKGELYFLFEDGMLKSHRLDDESWNLLISRFPEPYMSHNQPYNCWLTERGEDLIMICKDCEAREHKWTIFRCNWSDKCWVVERGLKGTALFVSGTVLRSAPLKDGNEESLEDCRVFYFDEYDGDSDGFGFKCYSLDGGEGRQIQSEEYSWINRSSALCQMCFIEPPYNVLGRVNHHWEDLPQDIFRLILSKLHFRDQIHFRAVCKSWRVTKEGIRCSDYLPWVISLEQRHWEKHDKYPFTCQIFDTHAQEVYKLKIPNSIENFKNHSSEKISVYASKHGWLLVGVDDEDSSLFLQNPFTGDIILLPERKVLPFEHIAATTFQGNPESPGCEIFLSSRVRDHLYISAYELSKDKKWRRKLVAASDDDILSVHWMKGELYCLFREGGLGRYSFARKYSWNVPILGYPEPYTSPYIGDECWLTEKDENIIVVRKGYEKDLESGALTLKWLIFRLDLSKDCWVLETSLKNVAFFISGKALFSAPLPHYGDCRVFYYNENDCDDVGFLGFKCYSLQEGESTEISSNEHCWIKRPATCKMTFIEPPYRKF